jgi:tetratricopeptide (TPR) repeat protein
MDDSIANTRKLLHTLADVSRKIAAQDHENAIPLLRNIRPLLSDDAEDWFKVSHAFCQVELYLEAIPYIEKAIALNSGQAEYHNARARLLMRIGDQLNMPAQSRALFTDACSSIQKAIEITPDSAYAHSIHGALLLRFGDFTAARDAFSKALELNENNPGNWEGMGFTQFNLGNLTEAERCYSKAIEINAENGSYHFGLGCVYSKQNQFVKAIGCYRRAVASNPRNYKWVRALHDATEKLGCSNTESSSQPENPDHLHLQ